MSKYQSRDKWESLYNKFLEQKGTMKEYCAQNNIDYRNFRDWCCKLKKLNAQTGIQFLHNTNKPTQSKFIKIETPLNGTITIRLPNGIIVETISKNLAIIIKELAHVI